MSVSREALAAALELHHFSPEEWDTVFTAARERLAQLEDSEGKRLHGLIRSWNHDLNDYAVRKFAKEIMEALNG